MKTENKKHTDTPWQIDAIQDSNGFHTIRVSDNTENGKTDSQPIASVFEEKDAKHIIHCVNSHDKLVNALQRMVLLSSQLDQSASHQGFINCDAIAKAREALSQIESEGVK